MSVVWQLRLVICSLYGRQSWHRDFTALAYCAGGYIYLGCQEKGEVTVAKIRRRSKAKSKISADFDGAFFLGIQYTIDIPIVFTLCVSFKMCEMSKFCDCHTAPLISSINTEKTSLTNHRSLRSQLTSIYLQFQLACCVLSKLSRSWSWSMLASLLQITQQDRKLNRKY